MRKKGLENLKPVSLRDSIERDFASIDIEDSFDGLMGSKERKFLRRFTPDDLLGIMQEVGLIEHLKTKGFNDPVVVTNVDESRINYLKLYDKKEDPDSLLIDLRLTESKFVPQKRFFIDEKDIVTYDMIVIEWLSAQNPASRFNEGKPQLPGQKKPGLGALRFCFEMMYVVAREVTKDGFLDVPDHAHGAVMYSRKFKFFDPRHEGILRAVLRDLKQHSLYDIAWGVITETVIDTYKQRPHRYEPSEQIFHTSERMKRYFSSDKYRKEYKKYYRIKKFTLDYEEMQKRREKILATRQISEL